VAPLPNTYNSFIRRTSKVGLLAVWPLGFLEFLAEKNNNTQGIGSLRFALIRQRAIFGKRPNPIKKVETGPIGKSFLFGTILGECLAQQNKGPKET